MDTVLEICLRSSSSQVWTWRIRGGQCVYSTHWSVSVCQTWCCCEVKGCVCWRKKQCEESRSSLGNELSVEPQPVEALPSVTHQFCHAAGVEDQRTHHFVQFKEEVWGSKGIELTSRDSFSIWAIRILNCDVPIYNHCICISQYDIYIQWIIHLKWTQNNAIIVSINDTLIDYIDDYGSFRNTNSPKHVFGLWEKAESLSYIFRLFTS